MPVGPQEGGFIVFCIAAIIIGSFFMDKIKTLWNNTNPDDDKEHTTVVLSDSHDSRDDY